MEATRKILSVILPTLGGVKGTPVFNNGVHAAAAVWATALKEAAYSDSIVVADLQTNVEALAAADSFEPQQDAISDTLAAANEAIDRIADGSVTRLEKSLRPLEILLRQIGEQASSMVDVFRVDPAKVENIRKATAQVIPIVEAEMRANERSGDDHDVILHLEKSTRMLGSPHYQVREAATGVVVDCVRRLAA